jgi:hypothetical protein
MLQRVTTVYVSVDLLSDHNAARRPSRDAAQVGDDTHSTVVQPVPVVAVAAVSRCGAAGDGYSEAGGSTGVRDAHGGSTPAAARCVQHRLPLRVSVRASFLHSRHAVQYLKYPRRAQVAPPTISPWALLAPHRSWNRPGRHQRRSAVLGDRGRRLLVCAFPHQVSPPSLEIQGHCA